MTPADHAALDELTASLRDGTAELDRRLRAVIDYITASPRPAPGVGLAPAAVRSGWDAAAAGSGRTGDTSPVVPGPAA